MKSNFLFFFFALLLHLAAFWAFSFQSKAKLLIPLRRGEPFELSRVQPGQRASSVKPVPSKEGVETGGNETLNPEGSNSPHTDRGVSDGAEFGIQKPVYPKASQMRGEEGKVLVKLTLDKQSKLVKVELLESSGYRNLDRSALYQVEKDLARSESGEGFFEHLVKFNFTLSASK